MVDTAEITILVDNQAGTGLQAEHGLSLWIEVARRRILFDTGQGTALPRNAAKLGIDLGTAEIAVLSHGHYDHTGGLALVAQHATSLRLYAHPSALLPRHSIRGGVVRDIEEKLANRRYSAAGAPQGGAAQYDLSRQALG
jgi:7,8-dihydropterin-6-yl-methyl-4-(beta-D-ribofuranosyl)aminobenzene 5'-phosphate synthase